MNEIERAKFEDKCEREIEDIYFKEVYNQLKKAQTLKPKHFQLVEKQELICKLQDTVKRATNLLYNLENKLDEYKPPDSMESLIKKRNTVYFEDHSLSFDTQLFQRTFTTINNIQNLTLFRFRRVTNSKELIKELQTTVKHLTMLLLKLENNIDETRSD